MKKLILAYLIIIIGLTGYGVANAFEIISVDAVSLTVTYQEPTQNTDLSPITDLASTVIYYDIGAGEVETTTTAASSPTGGGLQTVQIPVPIGEGQEADVTVYARAVDLSGNRSVPSGSATIRIDRLAPQAPL